MTHSPLPWSVKIAHDKFTGGEFVEGILSADGTFVETAPGHYPPKIDDAKFIVKAVNMHGGMLAILKIIHSMWIKGDPEFYQRIEKIIAEAEEE